MVLRKLQYFFTKDMGPYRFFDGFGPKFFCIVNTPLVIECKCTFGNTTLILLVGKHVDYIG